MVHRHQPHGRGSSLLGAAFGPASAVGLLGAALGPVGRRLAVVGFSALAAMLEMQTAGCAAKAGPARCDPGDPCDITTSSTATTGAGGSGGAGAAVTSTSATSNTASTTGSGGATTTGSGGNAGTGGATVDAGRTFTNRIVAYLPTYASGSLRTWATDMPWNRVSHVHIAFATASGQSISLGPSEVYLDVFVTAAHNAGAKVLVALGGAGSNSDGIAALYVPATVEAFTTNIAAYADAHNLDGIDVDIEGAGVNGNYPGFVDKLVAKLRPKGKLVTAALAQWFAMGVPTATNAAFDYVSVMSFDHCGSSPCNHSTYDDALRDLEYFRSRGVPKDRLVLGVPFYCHCWGPACTDPQIAYGQVVAKFPGDMDYIQSAGTTYSCNGPTTMQRKALLAKGYGGVMTWEISQDAGGNQSLLKVIADNL